jgi:hypothetical protein
MKNDIIKINVPTFLRLLEMVREDIKDDVPLHYLTEIVTQISQTGIVTMDHYDQIREYTLQDQSNDELDDIKRLGGIQ